MHKPADNQHPIHDLLRNRWSPRAFSSQEVEGKKLASLFEAARWSPSGANLQPWSYLLTTRESRAAFDKLFATLTEKNQRWARNVPVLLLTLARRVKEDGSENPWSKYDLGQSVAHLSVEASSLGLFVHQMGGFDIEKARAAFDIPVEYDPVTVVAVGYPGDHGDLDEEFRERELAARARRSAAEFVFENEWKRPFRQLLVETAGDASRN